MKNLLLIILLFATGCVLPETRTTVVTQHIFSQEDTGFYFSDCEIKSRCDSFELARITRELKRFEAIGLSKTSGDEIRYLHIGSLSSPLLIQLNENGFVSISYIENPNGQALDTKWDTLQFSEKERKALKVNRRYWHQRGSYSDSAEMLAYDNPSVIDSLYYNDLVSRLFRLSPDTVNIVTTSWHMNDNPFSKVTTQINNGGFWKMDLGESIAGTDGSTRILEVNLGNRHAVIVRDYNSDKFVEEICGKLLKYADAENVLNHN